MPTGGAGGTGTLLRRNDTLWNLGNRYIAAGRDVHFAAPALGAALANTSAFQYVSRNGPASVFDGYV